MCNPGADVVRECFRLSEKKHWIFWETFTVCRVLDEKTGNGNLFKNETSSGVGGCGSGGRVVNGLYL